MQVSFIVRAYNAEQTVRRTLESALAQDVPEGKYEVVVVDDGSTDGTSRLLNAYAEDPRVRIIRQDNEGIVEASNVGVNAAKGELVLFLDADDEALPSTIAAVLRALEDATYAYGYAQYFEEYKGERRLVEPSDPFKVPAGALVWRREHILTEGGFSGDSMFPEYDMLLRTIGRWKGKYIEEPIFIYHRRAESLTGDPGRVEREIEKLRRRYPENGREIGQIRSYMLS